MRYRQISREWGRPKFFVFETLRKVSGNQESIAFGPFDNSYLKLRRHCANALNKITNTYQESTEDIIIEEASVLTNTLIAWNGEPGYLSTEIQVTVASIIHQILFGKEENARNNEDLQDQIRSVNAFNRASGVGNLFDVMPWLRYVMPWKASEIQRIIQTSSDVRYKLTLNAKETFDINNMRKSIADMFLNADVPDKVADETQSVTRERLLRNINTLAGAGIETTSSTMMWLMTYMAAFPEVQARVQNELDSVVGQGRDVTLADRPKLPFTEATVLEVFRITSLVPVSTPRCTIKNTKLNGFDIDAGTVILPNQHSVNMDREFWIDPEQFRPERLLSSSQNLDLDKCNRILTFGHGRRKCVGERLAKMELFLLFANVILRCSIANAETWPVDLTQVRGLAYRPKPVKVVVRER